MDCFTDFQKRGLVHATTDESAVRKVLNDQSSTVYVGFDPTADSLHVGSMVPLLNLARLQRHGHRPIALAGGATGLIGDPSGKSAERNLLTSDILQHNVECIKKQLSAFLDFDSTENGALVVDNADWLGQFSMLGFLRDIGKHFSVNYMVAKDSVKSRLTTREAGISYTEFSYMLLQATDYLHLHKEYGCTLQVGGSDQWGNITAGMDVIRKVTGNHVHGMTFPLITTASGQKLGKTEQGTVWLDPERTSPYQLYQYYVRTDDRDAINYLNYFTFMPHDEIAELAQSLEAEPHRRAAQKRLALEMTQTIHGDDACKSAIAASQLMYGGSVTDITEQDLLAAAADLPITQISGGFGSEPREVLDLFADSGLAKSKGQARRLLEQGGCYVNNERRNADSSTVTASNLLFERYILLRSGKKNYHLLDFQS